VAEQILFF